MRSLRFATSLFGFLIFTAACSSSSTTRPTEATGGSGGSTGGTTAGSGGSAGISGNASGGGGASAMGGAGPGGNGGASGSGGVGGTAGNAGASASDGGAGAPANDGSADGGSSSRCPSGMPLCEDFDSQSAGSPPAAGTWTIIGARTCSTQGTPWPFAVDNTQWHSAPNSMKVSGGDPCGPLMLNTAALSRIAGGEVYGRFYVRLSDTTTTFDHAFLMALGLSRDAGAFNINDQGSYLQLASQGAGNPTNVLMWQTTDGNILPAKNTMGGARSTYPMASSWTCIEFHTSQATGALETWVNGTAVPGLTFIPNTTVRVPSVNDQWTAPSPFAPTSIGFGWTVFSGAPLTIWFDDLAVAATRIECL